MKYLTALLVFFVSGLHAQNYTLDFAPVVNAYVGQPVTISVTGTSAGPDLDRLYLFANDKMILPYPGWIYCANSDCDSLSASVSYTAQYPGPVKFYAVLNTSPGNFAKEATLIVNFACGDEYCPPNPLIGDFAEWMRVKGYDECIISKYLENYEDVNSRNGILDFLDTRPAPTAQVMNVDFYDIVPNDPQATYLSMGLGEGGNCQYNPNYPDVCPSPIPADYLYLEKHFEKTFGIDVNFIYHRIDTSYVSAIGAPSLINGSYYRFPSRFEFLEQFPARSIVHWAAQTWNGLFIDDMTGGSHVLESSVEPFNALGLVTYTHEWGHSWGLPHSFYYNGNNFVGFALDGIMSNTYPIGSSALVLDCMDPLERFALEPAGGFLDNATFVQEYDQAILTVPGGLLNSCGNIDPAAVSWQVVNETPTTYTVDVNITNLGNIFAGYIKLSLINNGTALETRLVSIYPSQPVQLSFTIDKSALVGTNVQFALDPQDEITDEDNSNNTLSFDIQCNSPVNVSVSNVSFTSADISWQDPSGTGNYQVEYRPVGGNWSIVNVTGALGTSLSNLQTGTQYEVQVRRLCNNAVSDWIFSSFITFCSIPQSVTINNITTNSAVVTWNDPAGLGNYVVDYRIPGDSWTSVNVSAATSAPLSNLQTGTNYEVRVKRTCNDSESNWSAIIPFTTICSMPQSLTVGNITTNSAVVSWSDPIGVGNYVLDYRIQGGNWTSINVIGSLTKSVGNLQGGTTYDIRVTRVCNSGGAYTSIISFSTLCPAPTSLSTVQIGYYSVTLSWAAPGASFTDFILEYRESGGLWTTYSIQGTSATITVLPNKIYEAKVKTACMANTSNYSNLVTFTTPNYCTSSATTASNDWLSLVKLGNTLNNPSGNNNGTGYHDYTSLSAPNLLAGSTFTLEFKAGQTGWFSEITHSVPGSILTATGILRMQMN